MQAPLRKQKRSSLTSQSHAQVIHAEDEMGFGHSARGVPAAVYKCAHSLRLDQF